MLLLLHSRTLLLELLGRIEVAGTVVAVEMMVPQMLQNFHQSSC
jgi:hypothetical protein